MKEFQGRVIVGGEYTGKCVVSHQGVNILASFQKSALKNAKQVICSDQNNPDLYNKNLTNVILCLPQTIGSTTGGLVLQTVCDMSISPAVMLFSKDIDSLAAAGVILSNIWGKNKIITIDNLGDEFLNFVKDGMTLSIKENGKVCII